MMAKYTLEQIDYLREKATISYEEAMETLERFDGDLARCLVDLERRGRIKPPPRRPSQEGGQHYRYEYRNEQAAGWAGHGRESNPSNHRGKAFVLDGEAVKGTLFSRVVVYKRDAVIADLSVAFLIFATFMAPHLMFAAVLLIFLMGYRVRWARKQEKPQRGGDLYAFVDKAAANIRRTADSVAQAVKNEVRPQPPREEDRAQYGTTANNLPPKAPSAKVGTEEEEAGEITIE
jgi:hypothetical protein